MFIESVNKSRLSVRRRSIGLSQFPKKAGKLHFHAPIEALVLRISLVVFFKGHGSKCKFDSHMFMHEVT